MLITLEGIDGAGKTTIWERLQETARSDDVPITFTREPTRDTWYGDAVYRSIGDDNADPIAELFLYMADHANHVEEVIRPAVASDHVVICDRYIDSRCAYQAASIPNMPNATKRIYDMHTGWSIIPELTLYLSLPVEAGVNRSQQANKFETANYLKDVSQNYQSLIESHADRYTVVDATDDELTVFNQVKTLINNRIEAVHDSRPFDDTPVTM